MINVDTDKIIPAQHLKTIKRTGLGKYLFETLRYTPDGKTAAERAARRAAYVDRVLRALQAELEESTGADMPLTAEEVVAVVDS